MLLRFLLYFIIQPYKLRSFNLTLFPICLSLIWPLNFPLLYLNKA